MALIKLITPNKQEVGIEPAHVVLVLPSGSVNNVQRWQVCHTGGGMFEVDYDGDLIEYLNGLTTTDTVDLVEAETPAPSRKTKTK